MGAPGLRPTQTLRRARAPGGLLAAACLFSSFGAALFPELSALLFQEAFTATASPRQRAGRRAALRAAAAPSSATRQTVAERTSSEHLPDSQPNQNAPVGDRGAAGYLKGVLEDGAPPKDGAYSTVIRNFCGRSFEGSCHSVDEATRWFDMLVAQGIAPTESSYNAVMKACEVAGQPMKVQKWMERMMAEGIQPNKMSYVTIISAFASERLYDRAWGWLSAMDLAVDVEDEPAVHTAVLRTFLRKSDKRGAIDWINIMRRLRIEPSVEEYNILLNVCARSAAGGGLKGPSGVSSAKAWFNVMVDAGLPTNDASYAAVIRANMNAGDVGDANVWFNRMSVLGQQPGLETHLAMVEGCAQSRDAVGAAAWMQRARSVNIRLDSRFYSATIQAFAEQGDDESAVDLLERMQKEGVRADTRLFNSVLSAYGDANCSSVVTQWFERMNSQGARPDLTTYALVLRAMAGSGNAEGVLSWRARMQQDGFNLVLDDEFYERIILALSRTGDAEGAGQWSSQACDAGVQLSLQSLNAVIKAYLDIGEPTQARHWLDFLMKSETAPDRDTYTLFIRHAAKTTIPESAVMWHDKMVARGLEPSAESLRAVVEVLAKSGKMTDMLSWLSKMQSMGHEPDGDTFSAVIGAYARDEDSTSVIKWLEKMVAAGFKPGSRVCTAIVSSSLKSGMLDSARKWFGWMLDAEVKPTSETFNAVLSAYAALGDAAAAEAIYEKMVVRDVVPTRETFLIMMVAWAPSGGHDRVLEWYDALVQAGHSPNGQAFAALAWSHAKQVLGEQPGKISPRSMSDWLDKMVADVASVDEKTLQPTLSDSVLFFEKIGNQRFTVQWRRYMDENGLQPPVGLPKDPQKKKKQPHQTKSSVQDAQRLPSHSGGKNRKAREPSMLSCSQEFKKAANLLKDMKSKGLQPHMNTMNKLLARLKSIQEMEEWEKLMRENGLQPDQWSYDNLMSACVDHEDVPRAVGWFEQMEREGVRERRRGPHHYHPLIDAVVGLEEVEERSALVERMLATANNSAQKIGIYNAFISRSIFGGQLELAKQLARGAQDEGIRLSQTNSEEMAALMLQDFDEESAAALLKNHSMRWSEELKKPIPRREQLSSFVNRSCMLELDKVTNSVDSVASWIYRQSLLDLRPEDVPFQELVVSYMRLHDRDSEAILWLNRMIDAGQLPTEELYEVMKSSRLQRRILRSYAIANDDDAVDAWVAFLQSCRLKPDQSVYEDMIINCIENGNTNEAVKWLQIMRKKGLEPNRETYMNIVFSGAKGNSDDDLRISMDALRQWLSMVEGLETSRIYAVLDSLLQQIATSQSQFRFGLMEEVVGEMSKRGVEPSAQALVALYRTMGPVAAGEMCRKAGFDMDNLARAMESASGRGSHMSL